jgi:hypothetical protein
MADAAVTVTDYAPQLTLSQDLEVIETPSTVLLC